MFACPPVAPTLYEQPQSQVTVQPSTATFTCSANGLPRPVISWLRIINGSPVPIAQSSKYTIATTPVGAQNQTSTLMILNTSPDDTTAYVCSATNVVGSVNASSTLSVQGSTYYLCYIKIWHRIPLQHVVSFILVGANINSAQTGYISNENSPISFQCIATGIPTPDIMWYRNGSSLLSSSDLRITVGPLNQQLLSSGLYQMVQTLTINNTVDSDSGSYSCVGSNTVNMDTSTFELFIRSKLTEAY